MGLWIPPDQRDPAYYIFEVKFMCRVTFIQSMSEAYIRKFGMPTTGDPARDRDAANELVTRPMTINEMVEFFRNGVVIHVVKMSDTKIIYEYISDHLNAWKEKLEYGFNNRDAPLDDLILLDKFAMAVYQHARHQFTTEIVESLISRRIGGTLRVSRDRILRRAPVPVVINGEPQVPEEPAIPERRSMSDLFITKRAIASGQPKWK